MNFSVNFLPTAQIDVPFPEVYWMEGFGEWTTLQFQMGVLRDGKHTVLINTGFPPDITALAAGWKEFLGDRAVLTRPPEWETRTALRGLGVEPEEVTHVIVTPIQLYATGNLHLFPNARMCFSRKGWIEDIIAPLYPHHVPRQGCISDEHLNWLMGENHHQLLLMADEHDLLPGIRCRWVGTHHRSSIAVEIDTVKGKVIASDCAFHYANVEESRPLGIAESIIEAHAAYEYIRREADHFIPIYDPAVQERYPEGVVA